MNRSPLALAATLGLALAAPAGAQAVALTTDFPCYIEQTAMTVRGTGFSANTDVSVSGVQIFASARTDEAGVFSTDLKAPIFPTVSPGSKRYTVTAAERDNPSVKASVGFRVTNYAFATTTGNKSPKTKRRWTFSGFSPGKPVYGHFRFKGHTRGTYRFGNASGACGELTKMAAGIPVKGHIPAGKWVVQVDQRKRYSSTTKPALRATTTVSVVFGTRRTAAVSASGRR
jgi:hypothetical protein